MSGQLFGDWDKLARDLRALEPLLKRNLTKATFANAVHARDTMRRFIRDQGPGQNWPPLKPRTVARKGSSKMLIDHGDLIGSIGYRKLMAAGFFVGVPRGVKRKGKDIFRIAIVSEYGAPRGNIPARPFVRPGFERARPQIVANYTAAIRATLLGSEFVRSR